MKQIRSILGICLIVAGIASLAACSGGGSGGSGGAPQPTLAGLWNGSGCCINVDPFPVIGITADSGDSRFLLLGRHYVGRVGAAHSAYLARTDRLTGRVVTDAYDFNLSDITSRVSAQASIVAFDPQLSPPAFTTFFFSVPYDQSFEQPSSVATAQGIYTTNVDTGYTLTITIDAAGEVMGNDTNGCTLAGQISTSHHTVDYYDVVLDVSACGSGNGQYDGNAALIFDNTAGDAIGLFLSASNASEAIGWVLDR